LPINFALTSVKDDMPGEFLHHPKIKASKYVSTYSSTTCHLFFNFLPLFFPGDTYSKRLFHVGSEEDFERER